VKQKANGTTNKFKVQLVTQGFQKMEGIDFDKTFALVMKWGTIWSIVALVANSNWQTFHLNVKITFLNRNLCEEVFMQQPNNFSSLGNERKFCHLFKAIYALSMHQGHGTLK
jgi:hypothetical protein